MTTLYNQQIIYDTFINMTGPLWVAQGSYYAQLGARYAKLTGQDVSRVISKFFSMFGFISQIGNGKLIYFTKR